MKTAADVMTPDPICCALDTPLGDVAKLMVQHDCGELPVADTDGQLIGVVTDRDIVCRVVAAGRNPLEHTVQDCVSQPVISVGPEATLSDVVTTMERHQIRRVPVVDEQERCIGIIALADLAWVGDRKEVAVLVREVSRETDAPSR
jgi:CBS domain-containing protein